MIKGLSYQNGIFFIGKEYVACAFNNNGRISDWVKPVNITTIFFMINQVFSSMPSLFKLFTIIFMGLVFVPKLLLLFSFEFWTGLPFYFLFYYMFGTHFLFPTSLKKFHGAEHKVFSDRGIKKQSRLYQIRKAAITNEYCSTNSVVIYFSSVLIVSLILLTVLSFVESLMWASYASVVILIVINRTLNKRPMQIVKRFVISVSYYLQKHVTTTEPDRFHLMTAIRSYRKLANVEFPHLLEEKKIVKEKRKMAIVDVTIIPIGTNASSVSHYVADIHRVLEKYNKKIKYQLTPMSTIIEGELPVLFEVIQAIHEVPFEAGVQRVATNIRIDDRRDKASTLEGKLASVNEKLSDQSTPE
ncbi:hypothetical protein BTR23_21350 [Alkalihalophilus pseudofirmus]|nr:hypothetical protein BTR23_21350 [Alkalihalophilus pseudofirmus]